MITDTDKFPHGSLEKKSRPGELAIRGFLFFCGVVSIATTIGILYELGKESWLFFGDERVSVVEFLTHTVWQPQAGVFGILPLVLGTVLISVVAIVVAVPIGLASAIYLSEYASRRVRGIIKPLLEVLVGIPTVVYGFFALTFVTPILRSTLGTDVVGFFNVLSPGIVVGFSMSRRPVSMHSPKRRSTRR
jgi:phosphate transport system permease protein